MNTLAPSFLMGSSSYLQVIRTYITSRTSSKFGQIDSSYFIFESIILILAGNEDMHESLDEFKFQPDTATNSRVICPCASEKLMLNVVNTPGPHFDRIFFIFAGKEDNHKVSTEFEIDLIGPRTVELAALGRLEKSP